MVEKNWFYSEMLHPACVKLMAPSFLYPYVSALDGCAGVTRLLASTEARLFMFIVKIATGMLYVRRG